MGVDNENLKDDSYADMSSSVISVDDRADVVRPSYEPEVDTSISYIPRQPKPRRIRNDGFAVFYFMWIGITILSVWFAVMNSFGFFKAKFPKTDPKIDYPIPQHIAPIIVTFTITHMSNSLTYNTRILVSVVSMGIIGALLPYLAHIFQDTSFGNILMLVLLFILGFFSNICYSSIAGLTSQIDKKYTTYFLIGVGVGSLLMSFVRMAFDKIFKYFNGGVALPDGDMTLNSLFFKFAVLLLILTMMFHFAFMRSSFYTRYLRKRLYSVIEEDFDVDLLKQADNPEREKRDFSTLLRVFKQTQVHIWLMVVASIQQHIAYPGLMLMKPVPLSVMDASDKSTSMIITFSVFYIFGKKMGQFRQHYNKYTMLVLVQLRFVLIGFFYIQAYYPTWPIFNTLWFGYTNILIFGIMMGILNVGLFVLTPEPVSKENKELAGFLAVFGLNFGTLLGDMVALVFKTH